MNIKKTRRSLSDLYSMVKSSQEPSQPTAKPKEKKQLQKAENTQPHKRKKLSEEPNLLDKLKTQKSEKITRITIDLDPETYEKLEELCEYTGLTKAKLLRGLIEETSKLLQKTQ